MRRNKDLSIRSAEATSLTRAIEFNKPFVHNFFNKLEKLLNKYKVETENTYNTDETAMKTVQGAVKVLAKKDQRHVGQVTSSGVF
ncbi:hypothetical protein NQ314_017982 [Rhamnusium bicolor]|uniref:Uncharacterized protein n=1 Tax=Rhamnusium bicolor TaxID=1586634 RepID=A0AAV8WS09_9CUCU|nr:hypothetical protein NQ314_017982 [Rhamnusium bicolor]